MPKVRERYSKEFLKQRRKSWYFTYAMIAILIVMVFVILFRQPPDYVVKDGVILGTHVRLVVSSKYSGRIVDSIFDELRRIDLKFNPYDSRSKIYQLNHSNGEWIEVDDEILFVLKKSLYYAELTGGAFDFTLGRLIKLWGFDSENSEKRVPSRDEIEEALKHVGYEKVNVSGNKVKLENGVWLDFGGIVKGYAIDRAVQIAKKIDPKATGFIDAGGDIGIIGPKFGGADWIVGIRDPRGESQQDTIGIIYLKEGSVATSGDYERFFVLNGKRYHHILNPRTGYPAEGIISATVIADSCIDADALSTAIFNLGLEYSLIYVPRYGGQIFIVDENQKIYKSKGFSYFEQVH